MEHIVQFAVSVDDDAIIKNMTDSAGKQVINDIKVGIINSLFSGRYYRSGGVAQTDYNGNIKVSSDAILSDFATEILKETLAEYKDTIIGLAAEMLADSYKRTKAWKERVGDAMEEVDGKES